jgi:hypothetical protein
VIDKHLSQSAMIDDVYLAYGEVKQGQSSVSEAFNVIPLYFCCEIGEKTVCQLIAYQFFTPAVFHYSRQDLLAEVYYLGPKLWHLVSLMFIKALFISACIAVDLHHHLILLLPLICLLIFGMRMMNVFAFHFPFFSFHALTILQLHVMSRFLSSAQLLCQSFKLVLHIKFNILTKLTQNLRSLLAYCTCNILKFYIKFIISTGIDIFV